MQQIRICWKIQQGAKSWLDVALYSAQSQEQHQSQISFIDREASDADLYISLSCDVIKFITAHLVRKSMTCTPQVTSHQSLLLCCSNIAPSLNDELPADTLVGLFRSCEVRTLGEHGRPFIRWKASSWQTPGPTDTWYWAALSTLPSSLPSWGWVPSVISVPQITFSGLWGCWGFHPGKCFQLVLIRLYYTGANEKTQNVHCTLYISWDGCGYLHQCQCKTWVSVLQPESQQYHLDCHSIDQLTPGMQP